MYILINDHFNSLLFRVVQCAGNHEDMVRKIEYLEAQLQAEGFQAIELEKCKQDLMKLKLKLSEEM